jgi:hypothetical protein
MGGRLLQGHIAMDAVQQEYLLALLGSAALHPAANGAAEPSSSGAAGMHQLPLSAAPQLHA